MPKLLPSTQFPRNVYIHIPFCSRLCSYCAFSRVLSTDEDMHAKYLESLQKEIQADTQDMLLPLPLDTLYFGGGTPSLLSLQHLENLFLFLRQTFDLSSTEITMECHPDTLSKEKIEGLYELGINRISVGVQTFEKRFDTFLERNLSSTVQALEILENIKKPYSIDMIFGFPTQSLADIEFDVQSLTKYEYLHHVSYYGLDYKPHSKLENRFFEGLPFEEIELFYREICTQLRGAGFNQYEIYNFCKSERTSLHNLHFWEGKEYRGYGLSAVSQIQNRVVENTAILPHYIAGEWKEEESIFSELEMYELKVKQGLRLLKGVSLKQCIPDEEIQNQVLKNAKTIPSWVHVSSDDILTLTPEGRLYFSEIMEILFT